MKKFLPVLFLVVFFVHNTSYSQSPTIQSIINQTNLDSLITFVEELSGEVSTIIGGTPYTILSRNKNQPGNDKAADYIQQKLEYYGLEVHNQTFGSVGRNVYGIQLGTDYPNQKFIICAHYDDMPSGSIAPGADDNASGTAAVLEAARIISQYISEYTIIYVLWDEEEYGLIGSNYYAQLAQAADDSILGVVNLDMIAYDSDNDNVGEIHIRSIANSLSLKDKMVEVNTSYNIGINPSIINPGTTASDQASFWNNGYGALLLIEEYYGGDFNAYYHSTNDLITHFNQPYYLKMSQAAIGTIATLANVNETAVPVELVSFSGTAMQDEIKLSWSTASELNNLGFEVERSLDENGFSTIGFVSGVGTSTETHYYSIIDRSHFENKNRIQYRLKQVDFDGSFEYSKVIEVEVYYPLVFKLDQNYPNPFNPSTKIEYTLPTFGYTELKVYDIMGNSITTLVSETKPAGSYEIVFDASYIPSGVYFYTLTSGELISSKKMMLVK
ncbi:MAG: M28 family peptidase [Ignavibacteriaceae bacterium]